MELEEGESIELRFSNNLSTHSLRILIVHNGTGYSANRYISEGRDEDGKEIKKLIDGEEYIFDDLNK